MPRSRVFLCALFAAGLFVSPASLRAQPKGPVSFINDVAPIFKENCFACHDAKKRKGKLDMTTFESLRKGGDNDDPIAAGNPDKSYLIELITTKGSKRMPPKDSGEPLTPVQVATIKAWIAQGAKLDANLTPKADLLRELRLRWKPPAPPVAYKFPININALAFTPDSKHLVVGGQHELTVWDVAQGKLETRLFTRAERAYAMLFLPDGKLAVAGGRPGQEGDVRVYNLQAKPAKTENGVAILDGVNDKNVLVKDLLDSDDAVLCLAATPDGKKLVSGGCDRLVNVWNLSGGLAAAKLEQKIENHADWVFGVAFTPDGKRLLTCSRDKTSKVWDLEKKESLLTFPDHQNPVYGIAARADGKTGYSVGEDRQLRTFNALGDGKQVRAMGGHGAAVFKVVVNPKQPLLATCSADNSVRLWNADSGAAVKTLSGLTDWVFAVAFSPDGTLVAAGGFSGEVKVWKVADGSVVKAFIASPGYHAAATPAPKPAPTPTPPKKVKKKK
jgi:WD40 repeat protein